MAGGNGIFGKWQPVYAEAGLAAFPVDPIAKKPMVSNYTKVGVPACNKFAQRFGDALALGIGCKRSRLTVLDVDTPDERVLADALDRHGSTPVIVRSGSGHFHAFYRNGGEKRAVKPDPDSPIDILGGGFVVVPPSQGAKGGYEFISGSLADLASLPRIIMPGAPAMPANDLKRPEKAEQPSAEVGKRNDALFMACLHEARTAGSLEALLARAVDINATFPEPLPATEVATVAQNAWRYQIDGKNRVGGEMTVAPRASHYDRIEGDHFAVSLLMILRRRWRDGETFSAANEMHKPYGFPLRKFVEARATLERQGLIVMVRKPIKGVGPAIYRFG